VSRRYLSGILDVFAYDLFDGGAVLPRRVVEHIHARLQPLMLDLRPAQLQVRRGHVRLHGPVGARGGGAVGGHAVDVVLGLVGRRRGLLRVGADEELLLLGEKAPDALPFDELPVALPTAAQQVINGQAVRLLVVRLDVVLLFELTWQ